MQTNSFEAPKRNERKRMERKMGELHVKNATRRKNKIRTCRKRSGERYRSLPKHTPDKEENRKKVNHNRSRRNRMYSLGKPEPQTSQIMK